MADLSIIWQFSIVDHEKMPLKCDMFSWHFLRDILTSLSFFTEWVRKYGSVEGYGRDAVAEFQLRISIAASRWSVLIVVVKIAGCVARKLGIRSRTYAIMDVSQMGFSIANKSLWTLSLVKWSRYSFLRNGQCYSWNRSFRRVPDMTWISSGWYMLGNIFKQYSACRSVWHSPLLNPSSVDSN
jgi:hypothetical protein